MRARHFLTVAILLGAACSDNNLLPAYDLTGSALGTTYNITLVAPPDGIDFESLQVLIEDRLDHVDKLASTYRSDSELSRFNAESSTDWVRVLPEFCGMVSAANDISLMTQGAFDITVGPLVNLWGFGPQNRESELPTAEEIAAAKAYVGYQKLETDCDNSVMRKSSANIYVDLSGWAKGYAVDLISTLLDAQNLHNYLIEIGGELRLKGHNAARKRFSIAIEKPLLNNEMAHEIVELSDTSVATSGDYRNFFEEDGRRYSHTIDPRTGYPVNHKLTGVTVVSKQTAYADAVATAFLVLGPEEGLALAEKLRIAAYFLVRTDRGIEDKSSSQFEQLERE
jgi:thiamine biosynthesis lipoprotein